MALPDFTMRQLLEAGAHFGHQSHRWNPKMAPYIYGARNSIHIIDLAQTVPLLHQALKTVSDTVAKGGRVLFVGTKRQASDEIAAAAKRSAQYFVNARWLGGMLTNWKTISASISRLRKLDELLSEGAKGLTKKERLMMSRERDKLETALGGIKDMGGVPDLVFVIDTNKEALAIKEANRLKIPGDRDPRHQLRPRRHQPFRSRPTTTPAAPSSSIAISSRARRSTASRAARARRASTSAQPRRRSPSAAGVSRACRGFDDRAGSADRPLRTPGRPARRPGRSGQADRRRPADRQEAQRARRVPLLAACRDDHGGSRQTRRRSEVQRPHRARQVERAGARADGRGG